MFYNRVNAMMHLLKGDAKPLGEVVDYFYRVEFPQRGAPHIHCLFWIEDAPKYGLSTNEVCGFIDQYISCQFPADNEDTVLHAAVSAVQTEKQT